MLRSLSATLVALALLTAAAGAQTDTITVLHFNDTHANLAPLGPRDAALAGTLGGIARAATVIGMTKMENPQALVLHAGDISIGDLFYTKYFDVAELQILLALGLDAMAVGNHEFDLGPDGLGKAITVASKTGRIPAVLSSNSDFSGSDPTLAELQQLVKAGVIRRHLVIERGGMRFGLFVLLGKEAQIYTSGGAAKFLDPVESARAVVKTLRETEKVDLVIALSHGGVRKDKDGRFSIGEDVELPIAVPGIDIVIGGHSHTELNEPIIANGRTPVVQTGKEGRNVGELVISLDSGRLLVESYRLYPIDDGIAGDRALSDEIDRLKTGVTAAVFASRGYRVDQPLAVTPQDLPNTFTDIAASTVLANLVTDAFRQATQADIGFNVNGMVRAPLLRGKTGVLTVYDVFAVAPLGAGVLDTTAGSTLVTGYFTGRELKNMLEFFLVDNPTHPGEYFPRASGMRFRYDKSRPALDVVTAIELGDLDRGYKAIDIGGSDTRLYSLTCSLYLGVILVAIPKYTEGKLALVAKNKAGQPLASKVEALDAPRENSGYLLAPPGTVDPGSVATRAGSGAPREIKEWQAIMDYLRDLPVKGKGELPTIPVDARAAEVRALKAG